MLGRAGRLAGHHDDIIYVGFLHCVNGPIGSLHTAGLWLGKEQNPAGAFECFFVARHFVGIDLDDLDILLLAVFEAIGMGGGENNLVKLVAMMLYHIRGGVVAKVVVGSGDDEISMFGRGHDAVRLLVD